MKYLPIIGLEIHVQLNTKSKMFCSCKNDKDASLPNSTVCPICLGHPGTLPVPNKEAIDLAIKAALALNCRINAKTKFDRKNYFYPDLPKGYQISQYDLPLAQEGHLKVRCDNQEKLFTINRVHLEEDAAKSLHTNNEQYSLIDFNRCGTPLIEIVTEPDFRSAKDAKIFLQELQLIMRYLEVSEADMEKGQLRCDANISLRPQEMQTLFPKTEIKNLNSFKAVEKALLYEIERQTELWERNDYPKTASTRSFDEKTQTTLEMRSKEESNDYRYFPEPDIPLFNIASDKVAAVKKSLPELPSAKKNRFLSEYNLPIVDVEVLTQDLALADFFEQVISELKNWVASLPQDNDWEQNKNKLTKTACNWLLNKLPHILNEAKLKFGDKNITAENFAELMSLLHTGAVNNATALKILAKMAGTNADPSHLMEDLGLAQIDNSAVIENLADQIIAAHTKQVQEYKTGKEQVLQFLLGQIMKAGQGKINAKLALEILKEKLQK